MARHTRVNPSQGGEMKTKGKVFWLFLATALLVTILLVPQPTLAQERKIDLTMRLVSHWSHIEVTAGKDNTFFLEISNIGSKAITDIKLSSDKPEGWVIDFKPERIDSLSPGSLQTVDVNIKPPGNAARGEHEVNFTAKANEMRKVQKYWVTVKTALWLWVGVGATLVVVAAFVFIYMRFSRQK